MRKLLIFILFILSTEGFGQTLPLINVGKVPNDGTGDPIRTAFIKTNSAISLINTRLPYWNTAYTERLRWSGTATGLNALTGRTSLGGTTIGQSMFVLPNPSAITFPRFNADNSVTARSAANFKLDLSLVSSDVGLGNLTNKLQIEREDSTGTSAGNYVTHTQLNAKADTTALNDTVQFVDELYATNGLYEVHDYATGGAGTEVSPWTGWDTATPWADGRTYHAKAGHYSFTNTLNLNYEGLILYGDGSGTDQGRAVDGSGDGTKFKFTGTGVAIQIDAGNITFTRKQQLKDFSLIGNAGATTGIYCRKAFDQYFKDLYIDAFTTYGLRIKLGQSSTYENIWCYYMAAPRIDYGIVLDSAYQDIPSGYQSTVACNIINPNIDGTEVAGIWLGGAAGNNIIGGVVQANTANGVVFTSRTSYNNIIGSDIEGNGGAGNYDVKMEGVGNKQHNPIGQQDIYVLGTENTLTNGLYDTVWISAAAQVAVLENLGFVCLRDSSTKANKLNIFFTTTGYPIEQTDTTQGTLTLKNWETINKINISRQVLGTLAAPGGYTGIKMGVYDNHWYGAVGIGTKNERNTNGGSWFYVLTHPRTDDDYFGTMTKALKIDPDGNVTTAGAINYVLDNSIGGNDTYTATVPDFVLTIGKVITFHPLTANTDGCTLNINGGGAKAIENQAAAALTTNDMVATGYYPLCWDGVNWVLMTK